MEHQTTGRVSQLEKEVHSLGSELHSQSRSLGELKAVQEMQGQRLDKIGDGVDKLIEHKGNHPTFTPTLVLSLMAAVFLAFEGVTTYLTLQLEPLTTAQTRQQDTNEDIRDTLDAAIKEFQSFRAETHFEVAGFRSFKESQGASHGQLRERFMMLEEKLNDVQEDIADIQVQSATNITAIRAIGDYAKEHVAHHHSAQP